MAANVQIDIKATDKATSVINGVNKSLGGMTGKLNDTVKSLTGFSLGNLTAVGALYKVGKFVMDATNETQKYNLAMVDMARKMGTTTEEASRLVQVGDDVRLTQEQISTAMTYAVRNGIQPNIAGLSNLADKYLSLKDPVERGQLLLKTFGRAGMDMGKLLEKGGDGIKNMAAAIEDGLVVTEEGAKASQKYYDEVDKLNDAWTAFKITVGNAVIPVLTDLIDGENLATDATWANVKALEVGAARQKQYGQDASVTEGQIRSMKDELIRQQDEWLWFEEHPDVMKPVVDNTMEAYDALVLATGATGNLTEAFIFNKAMAVLTAEEAYDLAVDMGILDKNSISASGAIDAAGKMLASKKITLQEYRDLVKGINQQLDKITEKNGITIDMYVDVWYRTHGIVPSGQTNSTYQASGPEGTTAVPRAAGGPAGGMTWVGENGPELVNLPGGSRVTSNKESMSMGFDWAQFERRMGRIFRDAGQKA